MDNLTIKDLINNVSMYNPDGVSNVKKAYDFAYELHKGQYRQSGEEYITHPLNVAYILSEMHADTDTLCAALLHDTLEDTNTTKEEIKENFNETVANLVDGVTRISKMNFTSKEDERLANSRKIITSLTTDVRIIIIKLADRLHNMRTISFKSEFKQKENAQETLEIFTPLAYYIGEYRVKSELEDISFKILNPDIYNKILDEKLKIEEDNCSILEEMSYKIKSILENKEIPNEIKIRTKNIYGIYKKMQEGYNLSNIHDLLALKIMVDEIDNCYKTLGVVHSLYNPFNSRFKDYIFNPKTNNYRSLHTTVFAPGNRLVQTQIRTFDMDRIASFGLTANWDIYKGNTREVMQEELKNKFQFYKKLQSIDSIYSDNKDFLEQIKSELFSKQIYVYTSTGEKMELPVGSTLIDYAYRLGAYSIDYLYGAIVNDKIASFDTLLKNNDRLILLYNDKLNKEYLEKEAQTSEAKRMLLKNKND